MAQDSAQVPTTTQAIDVYLDTGEHADVLQWFQQLGGGSRAKYLLLVMAEDVLREGSLRPDAWCSPENKTGERRPIRLKYHPQYMPSVHQLWTQARAGTRSATLLVAVRHAYLDVCEQRRGIPVDILAGTPTAATSTPRSPSVACPQNADGAHGNASGSGAAQEADSGDEPLHEHAPQQASPSATAAQASTTPEQPTAPVDAADGDMADDLATGPPEGPALDLADALIGSSDALADD